MDPIYSFLHALAVNKINVKTILTSQFNSSYTSTCLMAHKIKSLLSWSILFYYNVISCKYKVDLMVYGGALYYVEYMYILCFMLSMYYVKCVCLHEVQLWWRSKRLKYQNPKPLNYQRLRTDFQNFSANIFLSGSHYRTIRYLSKISYVLGCRT